MSFAPRRRQTSISNLPGFPYVFILKIPQEGMFLRRRTPLESLRTLPREVMSWFRISYAAGIIPNYIYLHPLFIERDEACSNYCAPVLS